VTFSNTVNCLQDFSRKERYKSSANPIITNPRFLNARSFFPPKLVDQNGGKKLHTPACVPFIKTGVVSLSTLILQFKKWVWRIVLGWDLVPRLPELFLHVGHTIQVYRNDGCGSNATTNATAKVYYEHYGDTALGLAGVPFSWSAEPYIWVPGALSSHHVIKYWSVLNDWADSSHRATWVTDFVHQDDTPPDDDRPPNVDDDIYVNPPDDDAAFAREGTAARFQEDWWPELANEGAIA
jgi:hypothetical protein